MQLLDAVWTPKINMVVIECDCGFMFQRRADMWKVVCPRCGKYDNLAVLRERCNFESLSGRR